MSSKTRFFENSFQDYSRERAASTQSLGKPHSSSEIVTGLDSKWNETIYKLGQISNGDNTVYTGTTGIALLKLLKSPDDIGNLQEIKQLLRLDKLRGHRYTFLCGIAGPLAVGAVVCHRLGEQNECKKLIERLMTMQQDAVDPHSDLPNEYLYGRAGYLYALLYVNRNINPEPIGGELIRRVIETILACGIEGAKQHNFGCPLMYQWHDSHYLGAAHGLSGILYLLLQTKQHLTEDELNKLVKPTIDHLIKLRFRSGNYPSSLSSESDKYVQWCHGAPGFVYLFAIAYRTFGEERYLKRALEAGDVVWQRGLLRKGYSICHGVAGNAYCFLELYQTQRDEKHLYRAVKFAEWCLHYSREHEEHFPDRPLSLYEGIAGPMYLLLDIQKPLEAKFPGFTL